MAATLLARDECIRLTPSKLVSWIVERYLDQGFERDQEKILQAHFNSKEFLRRAVAQASSDEELSRALEAALGKLGLVRKAPSRPPNAKVSGGAE